MIGEEGVCECHSYAPSSFSSLRDSASDTKKGVFRSLFSYKRSFHILRYEKWYKNRTSSDTYPP